MLKGMVIIATLLAFCAAPVSPQKPKKPLAQCCRRAAHKAGLLGKPAPQEQEPHEDKGNRPGHCGNDRTPEDMPVAAKCSCHKSCDKDAGEDPSCERYCTQKKCRCVPRCAT